MSVRVVARIRPLLKSELDKDTIVSAINAENDASPASSIVRVPNPKNEAESFTFAFNSVYEQGTTQQELFEKEGWLAQTQNLESSHIADIGYSITHNKTLVRRLRCHFVRIWSYWDRKDSYYERRTSTE